MGFVTFGTGGAIDWLVVLVHLGHLIILAYLTITIALKFYLS
jgi:hypothetical protein